jgi:adenylate cyclase
VGANYFLQWTIARAGDLITLRPSLYDTLSPAAIWSSPQQVSFRELPAFTHEIVRRLVGAMHLRMTEEEQAALQTVPTTNLAAYDAYLQGRMMLGMRDDFPLDGALHMLEVAVQADSNYSDALSALGWAHVLSYETESVPRSQHITQAQLCCQRALTRDPRNAEAYRTLGMVQEFRGDFARAIEQFEESTGIAPSDAESQRRLAVALVARGQLDDALKTSQRAVTVDPGDVDSYVTLGLIQEHAADYKGAAESLEQALRLAKDRTEFSGGFYADMFVYVQRPDRAVDLLNDRVARFRQSFVDYYRLGRVEQSAGRAKTDWQNALLRSKELIDARLQENPDDAFALTYLALVQTRLGEFRTAAAAVSRALKIAPNDVDVLLNAARMYSLQRDKKQALEYLSKYLHYRYNLRALVDMDFYNLRSDEEFSTTVTM